jgi:hypothetical protein
MAVLKKKLFWFRINLLFNYVKTGLLFVFSILWFFLPGLLVMFLYEFIVESILGYIIGWMCLAGIYFNIQLASGEKFLINKWLKNLETERRELRFEED